MPAEGRLSTPERAEKTYGGRGRPSQGWWPPISPIYLPHISATSHRRLAVPRLVVRGALGQAHLEIHRGDPWEIQGRCMVGPRRPRRASTP